ncbi:immunoglobulin superfamily DCC subclass member 3-like [Pocillopora verrucosa]|uniref:immunoglobulin superfamily DCC subclass member 3-like n=1 Tax=Pocillopora verrucosa TaxID=203993 RepID=UPI0033400A7C
MTRMLNTHWLGNAGNFFMLFLVTSAISNLSSEEMSNRCNSKTVIPEMDIFSSPPNRKLRVGADINLTCIAWPRNDHQLYPRKWTKYIQWYDPQGSPVGAKCLQGTPRVKELHCILMLKRSTMEQFGNYTCEAQNYYEGYCRQKVVEIELQVFLAPEIVEDPKNQTVHADFHAIFNCAARGHLMPSITWMKNDDALVVHSNLRTKVAKIFLDDKQIHSKLVVKGVMREDNRKYYCFAINSGEEEPSKPVFLSTKDLRAFSTTASPIKEQQRSFPLITVLGVCGGTITAFMSGCIMAFLYGHTRRSYEVILIECDHT